MQKWLESMATAHYGQIDGDSDELRVEQYNMPEMKYLSVKRPNGMPSIGYRILHILQKQQVCAVWKRIKGKKLSCRNWLSDYSLK